ncbi:MAG: hypothetical protein WCF67_07380 [Chitinophagaceae bacterium]
MALALAWLTISIPFVYAQQQNLKQAVANVTAAAEEECNGIFGNTTEEKTESGNNTLSEYLHDMHQHMHCAPELVKHSKCHPPSLYYAFHPELLSPPPELALS